MNVAFGTDPSRRELDWCPRCLVKTFNLALDGRLSDSGKSTMEKFHIDGFMGALPQVGPRHVANFDACLAALPPAKLLGGIHLLEQFALAPGYREDPEYGAFAIRCIETVRAKRPEMAVQFAAQASIAALTERALENGRPLTSYGAEMGRIARDPSNAELANCYDLRAPGTPIRIASDAIGLFDEEFNLKSVVLVGEPSTKSQIEVDPRSIDRIAEFAEFVHPELLRVLADDPGIEHAVNQAIDQFDLVGRIDRDIARPLAEKGICDRLTTFTTLWPDVAVDRLEALLLHLDRNRPAEVRIDLGEYGFMSRISIEGIFKKVKDNATLWHRRVFLDGENVEDRISAFAEDQNRWWYSQYDSSVPMCSVSRDLPIAGTDIILPLSGLADRLNEMAKLVRGDRSAPLRVLEPTDFENLPSLFPFRNGASSQFFEGFVHLVKCWTSFEHRLGAQLKDLPLTTLAHALMYFCSTDEGRHAPLEAVLKENDKVAALLLEVLFSGSDSAGVSPTVYELMESVAAERLEQILSGYRLVVQSVREIDLKVLDLHQHDVLGKRRLAAAVRDLLYSADECLARWGALANKDHVSTATFLDELAVYAANAAAYAVGGGVEVARFDRRYAGWGYRSPAVRRFDSYSGRDLTLRASTFGLPGHRYLSSLVVTELTDLPDHAFDLLQRDFPEESEVASPEAMRRLSEVSGPFALPVSAKQEFFTPEAIRQLQGRVSDFSTLAGLPTLDYKLFLCHVEVVQPDGSTIRIPSHILSTFRYRGKTYGGPFFGSALGNTLQARGKNVDLDYKAAVVRESLELTIRRFGLEMVTIAIPHPPFLAADKNPTVAMKADWFENSRATHLLRDMCGGTPMQCVGAGLGALLEPKVVAGLRDEIFYVMDASLTPIGAGRSELADSEFMTAMYIIEGARLARGTAAPTTPADPSARKPRGATPGLQDRVITTTFGLGIRSSPTSA